MRLVGKTTGGQLSILTGSARSDGHDDSALGKHDTGRAHIHAHALPIGQGAGIAVVVDGLEHVAGLLFGIGQAHDLGLGDRLAHRLTLAILVCLTHERVGLALTRPMVETTRTETLEHANTSGLARLVATLGSGKEQTIELAFAIPLQRIGADHELVLVQIEMHRQSDAVATTDKRERLNPPHRQMTEGMIVLPLRQLGNNVMRHRSPPSTDGGDGQHPPSPPRHGFPGDRFRYSYHQPQWPRSSP